MPYKLERVVRGQRLTKYYESLSKAELREGSRWKLSECSSMDCLSSSENAKPSEKARYYVTGTALNIIPCATEGDMNTLVEILGKFCKEVRGYEND